MPVHRNLPIHMGPVPAPSPCVTLDTAASAPGYPICRQTTVASSMPQPWSQIEPQSPAWKSSTRPTLNVS